MAIINTHIIGDNPTPTGVTGYAVVKNMAIEFDLSKLATGFTSGDSVSLFSVPTGAIALAGSTQNLTALTGGITRIDLGDAADVDRYVTNFTTTTADAISNVVTANFPFSYGGASAANRLIQLTIAASTVAELGGIIQVNLIYLDYPREVIGRTSIPEV